MNQKKHELPPGTKPVKGLALALELNNDPLELDDDANDKAFESHTDSSIPKLESQPISNDEHVV